MPTTDHNLALYRHQRLNIASKSPQNTQYVKYITALSYLLVELPDYLVFSDKRN